MHVLEQKSGRGYIDNITHERERERKTTKTSDRNIHVHGAPPCFTKRNTPVKRFRQSSRERIRENLTGNIESLQ